MKEDCLKLTEKISVSPMFKAYLESKREYRCGHATKSLEKIIIDMITYNPMVMSDIIGFKVGMLMKENKSHGKKPLTE